jgi:hypothetical protein
MIHPMDSLFITLYTAPCRVQRTDMSDENRLKKHPQFLFFVGCITPYINVTTPRAVSVSIPE